MHFSQIEAIKICCGNCHTIVTTPMDSTYRSQNGRIMQLKCPCCSQDLSHIASSAYYRAEEYNQACLAAEELQGSECSFIESEF